MAAFNHRPQSLNSVSWLLLLNPKKYSLNHFICVFISFFFIICSFFLLFTIVDLQRQTFLDHSTVWVNGRIHIPGRIKIDRFVNSNHKNCKTTLCVVGVLPSVSSPPYCVAVYCEPVLQRDIQCNSILCFTSVFTGFCDEV